jgi:hypothetical protein
LRRSEPTRQNVGASKEGGWGMGFTLEEYLENGEKVTLGDPFFDLRIAKVLASQRAMRTGRVVVVRDLSAGNEIARYEANGAPARGSGQRMRRVEDVLAELQSTLRERNSA